MLLVRKTEKNKWRVGASRTERKKKGRERKRKKKRATKPKQQFKSKNGPRKITRNLRHELTQHHLYSKQPSTTRNNRPLEPFPCTSLACSCRGSPTGVPLPSMWTDAAGRCWWLSRLNKISVAILRLRCQQYKRKPGRFFLQCCRIVEAGPPQDKRTNTLFF
jgi:hypothetical protein